MAPDPAVFDELIHSPHRLRICAALSAAHKVEFSVLTEQLGISKSALSKQLAHLIDAGYVTQNRAVRDSRSRLWLSLTTRGANAYRSHVRALNDLIAADA